MNITSCNNCGVLLDKDQLRFPSQVDLHDDETGEPNDALGGWDGRDFVPKVPCPVCNNDIF